jgi:hypothetical protein
MKRHESGTTGSKKRKRKSPNSGNSVQECSEFSQDSYKGKRVMQARERELSGDDVEELTNSLVPRGKRGASRPSAGRYRQSDRDERRNFYIGDRYREDFNEP